MVEPAVPVPVPKVKGELVVVAPEVGVVEDCPKVEELPNKLVLGFC